MNTYLVAVVAALPRRRSYDDLVPDLLVADDRLIDPMPDESDLSFDPLANGKHQII